MSFHLAVNRSEGTRSAPGQPAALFRPGPRKNTLRKVLKDQLPPAKTGSSAQGREAG